MKEVMMTTMSGKQEEQRMTSLDIAQVTGKTHAHVLRDIRNMEPAWEKECGAKFGRTSITIRMPLGGVRLIPAFSLTKTESLYVATKFNDEARARLVLRWEQLERAKSLNDKGKMINERCPSEQKLLVTEKEIMRKSDEIRRSQIADENADADGCYSASDIARMMEMTVKKLNKALVEEGVQFWNGGRYKLTEAYENSGFAQERSFHYYALDGEKKERKYLVWTPTGLEFIRTIL